MRLLGDSASVVTEDGSVFRGDLIVGADGVHSRIRSEMWRLADELYPGMITPQERKSRQQKDPTLESEFVRPELTIAFLLVSSYG